MSVSAGSLYSGLETDIIFPGEGLRLNSAVPETVINYEF